MKIKVARPMPFLGKQRTAGEEIDSATEPKLLEVSAQVINALKAGNFIDDDDKPAPFDPSQLHARMDGIDDRLKRTEALLTELLASVRTLLEGGPRVSSQGDPSSKGKKG